MDLNQLFQKYKVAEVFLYGLLLLFQFGFHLLRDTTLMFWALRAA